MNENFCKNAGRSFAPLHAVKATDAYLQNALEKEYRYLTSLRPEKLLYWFYRNAKLCPRANAGYGGGWESSLIGGHTLGHYLSALAQGSRNPGLTPTQRMRLQEIAENLVNELQRCQQNAEAAGARKGFLWGARMIDESDPEAQFHNVERARTNIVTQAWVPWYTLHKLLAGLYDVAVLTGNAAAKHVLLELSDWACARACKWSPSVRKNVLAVEYGGMNDILYAVYSLTGEEKYALGAHVFDEEQLFADIESERRDYLNGKHTNTTIPKVLGALNRYCTCHGRVIGGETVDAEFYKRVAEKFFDRVVSAHTYITGGNSEWEHFGKDGVLNASRTNCNCETCNSYNMLKLARRLFAITGKRKYLDYYETAYYNAILSSQNPQTGMTTYFQPMASGYFKVYSTPENSFWCCTGSGMESMTKLQDSIYFEEDGGVCVSLYLSSEYAGKTLSFVQEANMEQCDTARFRITEGRGRLRLRVPDWATEVALAHNGRRVCDAEAEGFLIADVTAGDVVELTLKKKITAFALPDGANVYALRYGPFVLSAELGRRNMTTSVTGVNVTVPDEYKRCAVKVPVYVLPAPSVADFMAAIDTRMKRNENGKFVLPLAEGELVYSVHYRQHGQRYSIYTEFAPVGEERLAETNDGTICDTRNPVKGNIKPN